MKLETPLSRADQLWEKRRANRHLRLMDVYEKLAEAVENTTGALQQALANRYRELIGVPPDKRDALRENLADLNGATVDEVVQQLQSNQTSHGF